MDNKLLEEIQGWECINQKITTKGNEILDVFHRKVYMRKGEEIAESELSYESRYFAWWDLKNEKWYVFCGEEQENIMNGGYYGGRPVKEFKLPDNFSGGTLSFIGSDSEEKKLVLLGRAGDECWEVSSLGIPPLDELMKLPVTNTPLEFEKDTSLELLGAIYDGNKLYGALGYKGRIVATSDCVNILELKESQKNRNFVNIKPLDKVLIKKDNYFLNGYLGAWRGMIRDTRYYWQLQAFNKATNSGTRLKNMRDFYDLAISFIYWDPNTGFLFMNRNQQNWLSLYTPTDPNLENWKKMLLPIYYNDNKIISIEYKRSKIFKLLGETLPHQLAKSPIKFTKTTWKTGKFASSTDEQILCLIGGDDMGEYGENTSSFFGLVADKNGRQLGWERCYNLQEALPGGFLLRPHEREFVREKVLMSKIQENTKALIATGLSL